MINVKIKKFFITYPSIHSFDSFQSITKRKLNFLNSFMSNQIEGRSNDKRSLKAHIFFR